MEPVIRSSIVKDVVVGLEHEGLCTGRAPPLGWCVRKCIEQHINSVVDEGVSMKLVRHITFDVENELQLLQAEEVGGSRVAFLNCIQRWRRRDGEIHLHGAGDSLRIRLNSYNRFAGAGECMCLGSCGGIPPGIPPKQCMWRFPLLPLYLNPLYWCLGVSNRPRPCRGGISVEPGLVAPGIPPRRRPLEYEAASCAES